MLSVVVVPTKCDDFKLLGQWANEEEFFALLTGVDGGALVMLDKLQQGGESSLADAEHCAFHVNPEVFVAPRSFKRHRIISYLKITN